MRKAFLLSAVAATALFAYGAKADVTVTGTVDICSATAPCTTTIEETLQKFKDVTITVDVTINPNKFAEAWTHFNQRNQGNKACENCAEKSALINNSIGQGTFFAGNVGITSVNQAVGNNNNQGTIISIALDQFDPPDPPPTGDPPAAGRGGFAESQVAGEQIVTGNTILSVNILFRDALINNSIQGNVGLTAVNQAAGNVNNQANATSIALSLANGVALSDAALGQFVVNNAPHSESDVSKHAFTTGSINNNIGVTQVNQSAGNLGNQSNVLSVSATFSLPTAPAIAFGQ